MSAAALAVVAPQHASAAAAGADCAACPLHNRHAGPVPPTLPPGDTPIPFLVVAEAPGPAEVDAGASLVGPAGREVRAALGAAGLEPSAASYTNAILCRPPVDLDDFLRECRKAGQPSPVECCRPRLQREIGRARFVLYTGGAAVKAAGVGDSVMRLRGTPLRGAGPAPTPGLATLHPSFVMRDSGRVMRGVFRFDVAKAVRLARGGSTWRDPEYRVVTTDAELAAGLAWVTEGAHAFAVDTETDERDPWTCGLRRIGIGTPARALIWAPLSTTGVYTAEADWLACRARLAAFFAQPHGWYFHNFYGFDAIVLAQHVMAVNEANLFDSLVGHHIGATSELPHGLDFLGSIFTDAPHWKSDFKHSGAKTDAQLDRYLSYDVAVTAAAGPRVQAAIEACDQAAIYGVDAGLSRIARSMSALGVRIDGEKRRAFADEYQGKAERLLAEFTEAAGRDVNPASVPQVRRLIYEDLGLPILGDFVTDAGEPSTAEPALLSLLEMGVDGRAQRVIQTLLGWREADKLLSTYLGRVVDGRLEGGPPTHADGRIRTTWKVYGTTSGRWSSGDPMNLQNVPKKLRAMFVPSPGNVFVAADYSALELRILALLAADPILIEAFRAFDAKTGPDIHVVNTCTIFKTTPDKVTDEARTFAKRFVYGLSYGAGPPKIFQTMSLLRDDQLRPVFGDITLADVEHVYKTWWVAHPEIVAWRKKLLAGWRQHGFIATPWHGRKRYFIGGENHEEMYNHPIQGAAADLQNNAVLTLATRYPFAYAQNRGLALQVHDQLVVECAESEAETVKAAVQESMQQVIGPMRFPAEAKVGRTWKDVS